VRAVSRRPRTPPPLPVPVERVQLLSIRTPPPPPAVVEPYEDDYDDEPATWAEAAERRNKMGLVWAIFIWSFLAAFGSHLNGFIMIGLNITAIYLAVRGLCEFFPRSMAFVLLTFWSLVSGGRRVGTWGTYSLYAYGERKAAHRWAKRQQHKRRRR
jgi:hypothetical protein